MPELARAVPQVGGPLEARKAPGHVVFDFAQTICFQQNPSTPPVIPMPTHRTNNHPVEQNYDTVHLPRGQLLRPAHRLNNLVGPACMPVAAVFVSQATPCVEMCVVRRVLCGAKDGLTCLLP